MGNRANIIFTNEDESKISPNIYLHWNGSAESVYSFLDELDRRKIRIDQNYECARFIKIVGDFFDIDEIGGLSLGITNGPNKIDIDELSKIPTDDGDNGFYIVSRREERRVRRFVFDYKKDTLIELSAEDVEQERKNAYEHEYNKPKEGHKSIKDHFIDIQGKRNIINT